MSSRKLAIKRINNDLKEITNCPLEGIGIVSIDNDPMKYVVNIQLMMGLYEGYCIQLLLTFSDNYPTNPPKILIYPGLKVTVIMTVLIIKDFVSIFLKIIICQFLKSILDGIQVIQ